MKVFLTEYAEENLWQIYQRHAKYSADYAERFQQDMTDFIFTSLSKHPELGTLYNKAINLRRVVYERRCNIYYFIRDHGLYVVYILDGRMSLNGQLESIKAELPTI